MWLPPLDGCFIEKIKTLPYPNKFLSAFENFPSRRNENSGHVLVSEKMDFQVSNYCFNWSKPLGKFLQCSKEACKLIFWIQVWKKALC